VLYNAPYSSPLNPIEYSFSKIKAKLDAYELKDEKSLIESI